MITAIEQLISELKEEKKTNQNLIDANLKNKDRLHYHFCLGVSGTLSNIITRLQQIVDEHSKIQ